MCGCNKIIPLTIIYTALVSGAMMMYLNYMLIFQNPVSISRRIEKVPLQITLAFIFATCSADCWPAATVRCRRCRQECYKASNNGCHAKCNSVTTSPVLQGEPVCAEPSWPVHIDAWHDFELDTLFVKEQRA